MAPRMAQAPKHYDEALKKWALRDCVGARCGRTTAGSWNRSVDTELTFISRVYAVEKYGSCIGAVGVEPLRYRCTTGWVVPVGESCGNCVLQAAMDTG